MQDNNEKPVKRQWFFYAGFSALTAIAMIFCLGMIRQCNPEQERRVIRTPSGVSDFAVAFADGTAELSWVDSADAYLDHIEITWEPDGTEAVTICQGIEHYTVSGLTEAQKYFFSVTAVDKWGNKSISVTGMVSSNPAGSGAPPVEIVDTAGMPPVGELLPVWADDSNGNAYPLEIPGVFTGELPSITGIPADGTIMVSWIDPAGVDISHIEIEYSPGNERVRLAVRGAEHQTFDHLPNDTEHTFTIYAVDSMGNKHPVESPRIMTPEAEVPLPKPEKVQYELGPLSWYPAHTNAFGNSTVCVLSYGIDQNGTGRWVAGGTDGKLAYSSDDGLNWTLAAENVFGSFSINTIQYNQGRWIAGGKSGKMAWSTNGMTWNSVREVSAVTQYNINVIVCDGNQWMAGCTDGIILLSEDAGVNWELVTVPGSGRPSINTLAHNGGRWVAGGTEGSIFYSDDNGRTWEAADHRFGNNVVNSIIYDQGQWIAGGYGRRYLRSDDGVQWQNLGPAPFYMLCMNVNGSRWVIGGQEGRLAWSDDRGREWVIDSPGRALFGGSWVQAIVFGKTSGGMGRWISAGQNGTIIYADEPESN